MGTCLWIHTGRRKWQLGICRGARRRRRAAEVSGSAAHRGWWIGSRESVQYASIRKDGSSNLIQCEAAFLDFSLTAGSSEGLLRSLSM